LLISIFAPFFKIGVTLACFIADGTIPVVEEELIIKASGVKKRSTTELATQGPMSSGPEL